MLGVLPPATGTFVIMQPPVRKKKSGINIQDLYETLEASNPKLIRRQNVEYAQLYTMYGGKESPRPDIISLPGSRPGSSVVSRSARKSRAQTVPENALRGIHEPEFETNSEDGVQRCMTSLSTEKSSAFCRRVKSAVNREVEGLVSSLSRQCCDVLGPSICHECNVVHRREINSRQRYERASEYPHLHVSEDNFTTAVLVSRMMPGVPEYLVQSKVACGEIGRETFKERLERIRSNSESNQDNALVPSQKSATTTPSTFFTSIRDLNTKLIEGSTPCHALIRKPNADENDKTFTEKMCPSFVSPKKMKDRRPTYKALYEPPLLPKVRQNAEPAFFAGSSGSYKLPDRLPDNLFSDQDGNGNAPMSRISTNYSINTNTPTQF